MTGLDDERRRPAGESFERLAEWLAALHAAGTFNGTVLIAKDGRVLFQRHFGFADAAGRVPLSPRSSFSLGAATIPFTALGILLLAQAGKLALDDPLARHIPELARYRGIALRHLLHHTSGIPDHVGLADESWSEDRLLTMPDVIGLFVKHGPRAYFKPGDDFEYSNTGYAMLGEVIARASGTTYPAFMAEAVFKPLGMTDSAAFNLSTKEFPLQHRVFGLRRESGRLLTSDLNFLDGIFGDGGIYASAEDLVRWDAGLREGTLMPADVYRQAYVSGVLNNGEETGYGFGWELEPDGVVEHWGEWEGFAAHILRDLRQQALLVVLSNLGPASAIDPVCQEIAEFTCRIDWDAAPAA